MNNNIVWALEGRIKAGQKSLFNDVMNDMITSTSKESGALNYEWSLGEDDESLHVYERYTNADTALSHLAQSWQQHAVRFMAAVEITRITTFSELTPELESAFGNAVKMTPIGGYTK